MTNDRLNLFEAVKLCDVFDNYGQLIYKLPVYMSWELQQFSDIIHQMKRLWSETVTTNIPKHLLESVNPDELEQTYGMMDEISSMSLPIIAPNKMILGKASEVFSEEEYRLLQPLWDFIGKEPK